MMNYKFEKLNDFLSSHLTLTKQDLMLFNTNCIIKKFKKGEIVIKCNAENKFLHFIIKGITRNYYITTEGYEKTLNFRMENDTVEGYSLYNKNISLFNVQCLEDCEIIQVPIEQINQLIKSNKNGHELSKFLAERHIIELTSLIIENDTRSVLERYEELQDKYPSLYQRVSQLQIASYLRITPEYLSKLKRSRILQNKVRPILSISA